MVNAEQVHGHLLCELSEEHEHGEASMASFVQRHLVEVLRPFGVHVEHLQVGMADLRASVSEAAQIVEDHGQELGALMKLIAGLRRDMDALPPQLEPLRLALAEARSEREALREGLGRAAAHGRLVDEQHRSTANALLELAKEVKGAYFAIEQLRPQVAAVGPLVDRKVSTAIESLHGRHDALQQAQLATSRSLKETARVGDETQKVLRRLGEVQERRGKEHGGQLGELAGGAVRLEVLMKNSADVVEAEIMKLEGTKASVGRLQRRVDQTLRAQACFENWQRETSPKVKELLTDVGLVTGKVDNLLANLGVADGKSVGRFLEDITDLQSTVGKHYEALGELKNNVSAHSERFRSNEDRFEGERTTVAATLLEADGRLKSLAATLGRNEDHDRFDREQREREAAADRRRVEERLEALAVGAVASEQRLQAQLPPLVEGLDAVTLRMGSAERALGTNEEQVMRISGSLDLTQEYWKGLTRGFREAHRTVAVDKELFPAPSSPPPPPLLPAGARTTRPAGPFGLAVAVQPLPALRGSGSGSAAAGCPSPQRVAALS